MWGGMAKRSAAMSSQRQLAGARFRRAWAWHPRPDGDRPTCGGRHSRLGLVYCHRRFCGFLSGPLPNPDWNRDGTDAQKASPSRSLSSRLHAPYPVAFTLPIRSPSRSLFGRLQYGERQRPASWSTRIFEVGDSLELKIDKRSAHAADGREDEQAPGDHAGLRDRGKTEVEARGAGKPAARHPLQQHAQR